MRRLIVSLVVPAVQRRRPQAIRAIAALGDGERHILRRTLPARCRTVAPALTG